MTVKQVQKVTKEFVNKAEQNYWNGTLRTSPLARTITQY